MSLSEEKNEKGEKYLLIYFADNQGNVEDVEQTALKSIEEERKKIDK